MSAPMPPHILIQVETPEATLIGRVDPDADLDGRFVLIEDETGDRFKVNGWCCDITHLDGPNADPQAEHE